MSAVPVSVFASASSAADALIDARIVDNTKKLYESKLRTIERYYSEKLQKEFKIPVARQDILSFFGWLIEEEHKDKPLALSSVRHFKSALLWYYKEYKQTMHPKINQELETLVEGYKRKIADWKLEGKMPIFEGKYHLTFEGYRILARLLLTTIPFPLMLFGWPYFILQWNLIARCDTVSSIMMEHVGWEADSLLITTPKHKGDQEGVKCFARHVYANPSDPTICPVLALAVLIFVRSLRHDPASSSSSSSTGSRSGTRPNFRVFDGRNNNSRFSNVLHHTIHSVADEDVHLLGGERNKLGTHSIRKGAASYCTGMINGPSAVQVFLRAGWSLGNVQDRYLFAGAGGDQVTGRVLSGLPFNDSSFASLPPHFTPEGTRMIDWASILPMYESYPNIFKQALPHLLASICYHQQWLKETLPCNHPLFSSHAFASGAIDQLKPHVIAGCNRCPITGLLATGIPPHLVLSNELSAVVRQNDALRAALLSRCDQLQDQLPTQVTNLLRSRLDITGVHAVTIEDIRALLATAVADMRLEIRDAHAIQQQPAVTNPSSHSRFQWWTWGERMHMVPQGWILPSTNIMDT